MVFDEDAVVQWVNETAAETLLIEWTDTKRWSFSSFVYSNDTELFFDHLRRCRAFPEHPNLTHLRLGAGDRILAYELLSLRGTWGGRRVFRTALLPSSSKRFSHTPALADVIIQMLDLPLCVIDDEFRIQWSNRAFQRFFGSAGDRDMVQFNSLPGVVWNTPEFERSLRASFSGRESSRMMLLDCTVASRGAETVTFSTVLRRIHILHRESLVLLEMQPISERMEAEAARDFLLKETESLNLGLEKRVEERTRELKILNRQVEEASAAAIDARESERRHLALELHDEVGQRLTGLNLNLAELSRIAPPDFRPELAGAQEALSELTHQVRKISVNLRPQVLDDFGLLTALRWHFDQFRKNTGLRLAFTMSLDPALEVPPRLALTLYRVVQEALNNITKHSEAKSVKINLSRDSRAIHLRISDNGKGFDTAQVNSNLSSGLSGMSERLRLLGGHFKVDSARGRGTHISVDLPLNDNPVPLRKEIQV